MLHGTEEQPPTDRVALNPWLTIWTQPRATVAWAMENDPKRWLWLLILFGGTSRVLMQLPGLPMEEAFPGVSAAEMVELGLLLGPVAGVLVVFVFGRLLHLALGLFGGKASWIGTRTAIAWALAPGVASTLLWLVMLASHGPEIVISSPADYPSFIVKIDYGLHFVFTGWMVVLEVLCLAHVHRIPLWKVVLAEVGVGFALLFVSVIAAAALLPFLVP